MFNLILILYLCQYLNKSVKEKYTMSWSRVNSGMPKDNYFREFGLC